MRGVSNGHDHVAGRSPGARLALTAQPDGLPFLDAGGDCDVQGLPRRQNDAGRPPIGNRRQGNRDCDADILPPGGLTSRAGAARPEQFRQDIRIDRAAFWRKSSGAEVEAEIAKVRATRAWLATKAETLEL